MKYILEHRDNDSGELDTQSTPRRVLQEAMVEAASEHSFEIKICMTNQASVINVV
jgi:hypothetical protein